MSYSGWGFLLALSVFLSWLFLFIYRHVYAAISQEAAISNLRSELAITKVQKIQYEGLAAKFSDKQSLQIIINFSSLQNPFKSTAITKEKK